MIRRFMMSSLSWLTRERWPESVCDLVPGCKTRVIRPRRVRRGSRVRNCRFRSRLEREQFRAVLVEPLRVAAPARAARGDEPPEARRVVQLDEVADLVDDDVVEHVVGGEHEPPVERERAA